MMQFGKEIRDVLVAMETATTDAIRAVDQMNESESDVNALLAGTAVARVGELNTMLFQKIEAAATQMIVDLLRDLGEAIPDDVDSSAGPSGWMN
jgi:hypothetical protein